MNDAVLIFNPAADHGRAEYKAPALRSLVSDIGGADWLTTERPGHAAHLAWQAALDGYKTVVAVGGDGIAHEVINGLMRLPQGERPYQGHYWLFPP